MKSTSTPHAAQYVGLMLLLLSVGTTRDALHDDVTATFANVGHAPFLVYAASFLRRSHMDVIRGKEEEDEEEGVTDSDTEMPLSELPLDKVIPYLDLRSLACLRRVSRKWQHSVPMSHSSTLRAFFVPWNPSNCISPVPPFLRGLRPSEKSHALRRALQWQCDTCGFWNPTGRTHCANAGCLAPGGMVSDVKRLFIGQMRKEDTASLLGWIIGLVCPGTDVVHIESHTNPSQGGRGKGCAWLYVRTPAEAASITSLDRRVFVDVDPVTGQEGIWVCGPDEDDKDVLTYFASQRATDPSRLAVLPKNPFVVEVPSASGRGGTGGRVTPAPQAPATMRSYGIRAPPPPPPTSYTHHHGCQCQACYRCPYSCCDTTSKIPPPPPYQPQYYYAPPAPASPGYYSYYPQQQQQQQVGYPTY